MVTILRSSCLGDNGKLSKRQRFFID